MNYCNIKKFDIANGEGIRTTLFVSGCTNKCKNCFQPETWSFDYGEPFTEEVEEEILDTFKNSSVKGLTLLGGEPMEPSNQRALLPFLKKFKSRYPNRNLWLFTGNLYEELMGLSGEHPKCIEVTREILDLVDILVDGRFVEEEKKLGLRFRGSANQRIIDMNKTRKEGKIVIWEGCLLDKQYSKKENKNDCQN